MAVDATGTPTSLGIPTLNTAVDAPSGKGINAMMAAIDALLPLTVKKAGTTIAARKILNFIEGSGVTITAADDGGGAKVDLTFAASAAMPSGMIVQFAGSAAPSGWLLCDGASLLRTAPNDLLFAAIGTTYGSVDGTHFNLPDLQGRIPVGKGTHADVSALGNNDGLAAANRRPTHKHTAAVGTLGTGNDTPDHTHTVGIDQSAVGTAAVARAGSAVAASFASGGASARHTHPVTGAPTVGPQTGAEPTDTVAYIVINYIIKL